MSCGLARAGRICFSSKPKRSERRDGKFWRRRTCVAFLLVLIIGRHTSFSGGGVVARWGTRGVGRWMAPLSNTGLLSGGKSLILIKGLSFEITLHFVTLFIDFHNINHVFSVMIISSFSPYCDSTVGTMYLDKGSI